MKNSRYWISILAAFALVAMFLKMPEMPNVFSFLGCKACTTPNDPYLPLFGAAYFAAIIAISLLFPGFPGRHIARGGLIWAILLAAVLTYLSLPNWCVICLIGHACNILIWSMWKGTPMTHTINPTFRGRLCLTLFAPLAVVGVFSSLNLTLMAYGFKVKNNVMMSLQSGDSVPAFALSIANSDRTITNADIAQTDRTMINFISPNCPYCEEQLGVLKTVVPQLANGPYRFINISPALPSELIQKAPAAEWVEDKEGRLRELFRVSGFPTLFVVGKDGKIVRVIPGVPEQLKAYLLSSLGNKLN